MDKLSAENLKNTLWESLNAVKGNEMESEEAHAIAAQSREIMRVVNAQVTIAKVAQKHIPNELTTFAGCAHAEPQEPSDE